VLGAARRSARMEHQGTSVIRASRRFGLKNQSPECNSR
ncbi:hypothetical protein A2U01_0100540, partial [Trifolium medium]|nr:hypothetical protein [Trifolium medium]